MKRLVTISVGGACAAAAVGCGGGNETLSGVKLDAKIKPSVVRITGKIGDASAGGSGFVLDAKRGLVATNAHVVAGLEAIRAKVGDSTNEGPATVLATAPCDDVALVQLSEKPPNLKALKLGNSSKVKSGQNIVLYGFPESAQSGSSSGSSGQASNVVSNTGTVSAANIQASPGGDLPRLSQTLQHQAPTNAGDSGGPVVDQHGEVVGMTSIGANPSQAQNVNYSIAIDKVKSLLPTLRAGTSLSNVGWHIVPLADALPNLPDYFATAYSDRQAGVIARDIAKKDKIGVYVNATDTGSPARNAKIISGDVVQRIEGRSITNVQDACDVLQSRRPGDKLRVSGYELDSASDKSKVFTSWTETVTLK